ncbi:MAG: ribbon-helix-helix domain-containing protein [Acidobacteria bacterium]|nr:ribbon-helix-helix domain-containing protein [Acidobacteriota bacterium]
MKRVSILLSEELHEQLKQEAQRRRVSFAEMVRIRLAASSPRPQFSEPHPMEEVIGIASVGGLTDNIDRDLYGI